MNLTWISLLPPLIVIVTMIATKRLNISLGIGIISAAIIVTNGQLAPTGALLWERTLAHFTDISNIYLYLALIAISSLITLLTTTGSAAACGRIIGKKVNTQKGAETSSILLSLLLSIDDYLSILTVGFVMQPLTDRLAITRAKLAYLTHSLSGPLAIIMPISTWAATILAQLDNAGINTESTSKIVADPFYVYLSTIPFIFYSFLTAFSVAFIVHKRISYGSIDTNINNYPAEKPTISLSFPQNNINHSLFELLMPILLLVGTVIIGILYAGSYHLFGGSNSFFEAFKQNNQTFLILFIAGTIAFTASTLLSLYKKMITVQRLPHIILEGFILMKDPIIMVILASILGSLLRLDLHTGSYVAYLLLGTTPLYLIPAMLFITSLIITMATGSAWGTFSLLIPITTQMLISLFQLESPVPLAALPLFFPTLGALLSGASCGDHLSPFSETTTMTAASTGIKALTHARTQLPYALPVAIGTLIAFFVSGLLYQKTLYINFIASAGIGLIMCLLLITIGNQLFKNKTD